jgi:hypothetical protein
MLNVWFDVSIIFIFENFIAQGKFVKPFILNNKNNG